MGTEDLCPHTPGDNALFISWRGGCFLALYLYTFCPHLISFPFWVWAFIILFIVFLSGTADEYMQVDCTVQPGYDQH